MPDKETNIPENETVVFWRPFSHEDLAVRTAALHQQRRKLSEKLLPERVAGGRYAIAAQFLSGVGIEVGAGDRPFPLPEGVRALRGDIRNAEELTKYFATDVGVEAFVDAQTFAGVMDESQDFLISAHVIEHLIDPIGAIQSGMRVLKQHGHYLIVVPDQRYTFDKFRPLTSLEHLLADWRDGGHGTRIEAFVEFLKYVDPSLKKVALSEAALLEAAEQAAARNMDIHFHTWTFDSFRQMLCAIDREIGFEIVCAVGGLVNESIFVLRKERSNA